MTTAAVPPAPRRSDAGHESISELSAAATHLKIVPPPAVATAVATFIDLSRLSAPAPQRPADAESTVATALQCVICMAKERTHLLFPCGHKCLCVDCADPSVITLCPLCRRPVVGITEVFD